MTQMTVGLDLGSESVKRVRLSSSFRSVEVVDLTSIEVTQDTRPLAERLAEALQKLEDMDSPADIVATALPGNVVSLRTMTLPFTDSKRINQTIGYELESQIPFSLDQVVFDYLRIVKNADGVRLMATLCQVEQMQKWLETFQSVGIDPRLVGADCLAYSSLKPYLPQPEEGTTVTIVDIGHTLTSICFLGEQGVEFGRTLSVGGQAMTLKLADAFDMDFVTAEDSKRREGYVEALSEEPSSPEQEKMLQSLRATVDTLVREIRQTFVTHRTLTEGQPVSKVWLCGGGARVDGLDAYLSAQLDVEVEHLAPEHIDLEGVERLGEQEQHSVSWVKALGLALHAHQGGRTGWLNLRKGPFAFKGDFSALKGKVLQVAVAIVILVVLAIGQAAVSYFSLRSTDKLLDQKAREATRAILGKPYDNLDVALGIIREQTSPESDPLPRITALDMFFEIHNRIPKDLELRLRDIDISPKRINIEGVTGKYETVSKIQASLKEYECFQEVKEAGGGLERDREGRVRFKLTIVNGC